MPVGAGSAIRGERAFCWRLPVRLSRCHVAPLHAWTLSRDYALAAITPGQRAVINALRRRCRQQQCLRTVASTPINRRGTIVSTTLTSSDTSITRTAADRALKAKHAAMWASGSYPTVVDEVVAELGNVLVEAVDIQPGQRVLDVAAGTGTSALPAARRGATVTATDLTPELLEVGRADAARNRLDITWKTADAEALPYPDGEFDVVLSAIGVMFAPHHQQAADELIRVCRPGGTIAILNWTPEGFIGHVFATMKPYAPPPPPGASPAPLWGRADHVHHLFADRVTDLVAHQRTLHVDRFTDGVEFREFMKTNYGPTIAVYRFIADDPAKVAALDAELTALGDRFLSDQSMQWEYLLVTARRV
jgi:ubiquinone/menaquinone biosynthesis C-methylase UbiE